LGGRWELVSGKGIVYSFTWVVRGAPGFERDTPYALGLVELEEGPVLATRILGTQEEALAIGIPVEVEYHDVSPDLTLPYFRPTC
jgi:uncharacterized OB-fold protein